MLDYVEISSENWSGFSRDVIKPYRLKYDEDEKQFCFSHGYNEDTVFVNEKKAKDIFSRLEKLDYMKILNEASCIDGCDGGRIVINLSMGMHNLKIALWAFPYDGFGNLEETGKLEKIYRDIDKLAQKSGFNNDEIDVYFDSEVQEHLEFMKWKIEKKMSKISEKCPRGGDHIH